MPSYSIEVRTGTKNISGRDDAGTDARVWVKLNGSRASTKFVELADKLWFDEFEEGDTDDYTISTKSDLGTIESVEVTTDGDDDGWRLDSVQVNGRNFPANNSVLGGQTPQRDWEHRSRGHIKLTTAGPVKPKIQTNSRAYNITVKTSSWITNPELRWFDGPGTDSKIYMSIIGSKGYTRWFLLTGVGKLDNLTRGSFETFRRHEKDVGEPVRVQILSDGSGPLSAWGLDRVVIDNVVFPTRYVFDKDSGFQTSGITLSRQHGLKAWVTPSGTLPRLSDLGGTRMIQTLDMSPDEAIAPIALGSKQAALLNDYTKLGVDRTSFAGRFVDPATEEGYLYKEIQRITELKPNNADAQKLADQFETWVTRRHDAQNLFKKMDEYLDTVRRQVGYELKYLNQEFSKPLSVTIPGQQQEEFDSVNLVSAMFNVLTIVPNPVSAVVGMAGVTTSSIVQMARTSQSKPQTILVDGGKTKLQEAMELNLDLFYEDSKVLLEALEKVVLRSAVALRECADFELQTAAKSGSTSQERSKQLQNFFPETEGIRSLARRFWKKIILKEMRLLGKRHEGYWDTEDALGESRAKPPGEKNINYLGDPFDTYYWYIVRLQDVDMVDSKTSKHWQWLIQLDYKPLSDETLRRILYWFEPDELVAMLSEAERVRVLLHYPDKIVSPDENFEYVFHDPVRYHLPKQTHWQLYERKIGRSANGATSGDVQVFKKQATTLEEIQSKAHII